MSKTKTDGYGNYVGSAQDLDLALGALPFIRGTWYFVDPLTGLAANDGLSPGSAKKALKDAYDLCTSGAGDGILVISAGTSAAETTTFVAAAFDWSKHGITVIGIASGAGMFGRARVANVSATQNLAYLISVTGNNNHFENLLFINEGTNAAAIGCLKIVGGARNKFKNCHIAGAVGAASIATKYALTDSAGEENEFEKCTFGTDSFSHGNHADAELILSGACARERFIDCEFLSYVSAGTAHAGVALVNTSGGRGSVFKDCLFNSITSLTTPAAVFIQTGSNDKVLVTGKSALVNFTAWGLAGVVYTTMPTATASAGGGIATTA
jgi:hypothetical protein